MKNKEKFKPIKNFAPSSPFTQFLFYLRLFGDLGVWSVYRDLKKELPHKEGSVLEVGAGDQAYRHLLSKKATYKAIDLYDAFDKFDYSNNKDTITYNGKVFPFSNESFDFLFHCEVLEHVYEKKEFLEECYRVLSPQGEMLFTVPFSARFHYIPHDFWRFTPSALERILEEVGFKNIRVQSRGSDLIVALMKINAIFYRKIFANSSGNLLKFLKRILFLFLFFTPLFLTTSLAHICLLLRWGSFEDPIGYTVVSSKTAL